MTTQFYFTTLLGLNPSVWNQQNKLGFLVTVWSSSNCLHMEQLLQQHASITFMYKRIKNSQVRILFCNSLVSFKVHLWKQLISESHSQFVSIWRIWKHKKSNSDVLGRRRVELPTRSVSVWQVGNLMNRIFNILNASFTSWLVTNLITSWLEEIERLAARLRLTPTWLSYSKAASGCGAGVLPFASSAVGAQLRSVSSVSKENFQ